MNEPADIRLPSLPLANLTHSDMQAEGRYSPVTNNPNPEVMTAGSVSDAITVGISEKKAPALQLTGIHAVYTCQDGALLTS